MTDRHDETDARWPSESDLDVAALYALGALEPAEARSFEVRLAASPELRAEVDALRQAAVPLTTLAPSATPRPELKADVLRRVRADQPVTQVWKRWEAPTADPAQPGLMIIGKHEGAWETTGVAGVEVKKLFVDAAQDRVTMLVRMAPGTAYPGHVHKGAEECYVIEGDLWVGSRRMKAGDYQRADEESLHGVQSTEHGCLLFIVSSLHDELTDALGA